MSRFRPLVAAALLSSLACSGPGAAPLDAASSDAEPGPDAADTLDATSPTADAAEPAPCPCFDGDGPSCAGRARALADAVGCSLPLADEQPQALLVCSGETWEVAELCADRCEYDPEGEALEDGCVLPVCECFVREAWCGSGAQEVADEMGCQIPLLPEHNNDILYCPDGEWGVRTACEHGCVSAPVGTPDSCRGDSDYLLPFDCGESIRCSSGNHTSNHADKDAYAFDFAVPHGTTVRAMRGGTVLRVRNVSSPGDGCYDGGGSACANLANTVEVRHDDGTVGLYMHLSRGTVSVGETVAQGDPIGRSGNSGWSTGPHLHVHVQRDCGIWWCQSVPFTFGESSGIRTGTTTTSQNCR